MKVVLRGSSGLISLLGTRTSPPASRQAEVLRRGSAGRVQIGMTALDVLEEFGSKAKFNELNSRADVVSGRGKQRDPALSIEMTDGYVTAIQVFSPDYKTENGIGPGDTLIALANHYPIRWTEDNTVEVRELGMKFTFAKDQITSVILS